MSAVPVSPLVVEVSASPQWQQNVSYRSGGTTIAAPFITSQIKTERRNRPPRVSERPRGSPLFALGKPATQPGLLELTYWLAEQAIAEATEAARAGHTATPQRQLPAAPDRGEADLPADHRAKVTRRKRSRKQ